MNERLEMVKEANALKKALFSFEVSVGYSNDGRICLYSKTDNNQYIGPLGKENRDICRNLSDYSIITATKLSEYLKRQEDACQNEQHNLQ